MLCKRVYKSTLHKVRGLTHSHLTARSRCIKFYPAFLWCGELNCTCVGEVANVTVQTNSRHISAVQHDGIRNSVNNNNYWSIYSVYHVTFKFRMLQCCYNSKQLCYDH